MKWPINPNKQRSPRKHADDLYNLSKYYDSLRMCVSCGQSTKVGIVNYVTYHTMM